MYALADALMQRIPDRQCWRGSERLWRPEAMGLLGACVMAGRHVSWINLAL
jgi:hypothetical protein